MSKRGLVKYFLKGTLYISWTLGMFPFKIDYRNRQLHSSKWILIYGLLLNVFLLWTWIVSEKSHIEQVQIFAKNPLVEKIQILLNISIVVWSALGYWRVCSKHSKLLDVLNRIIIIGQNLDRFASDACSQFEKYVILKLVVVVLTNVTALAINVAFYTFSVGPVNIFNDICFYLIYLGNEMTIIHFYLAVIQIYCFLWNINKQLMGILEDLKLGGTVDVLRVKLLLRSFGEVLNLNSRLTSIYDQQVICFMVTLMCNNIYMAYVLIFLVANAKKSIIFVVSILSQYLVVTTCNLWLTFVSCDLAECEGTETTRILKLFTDVFNMDQELERTINEFAIFCKQHKLKYFVSGLFTVNVKMGYRMIITNVMYVLCIIQFDYKNLQF